MTASKQADIGDIEDKICWTLTSMVQQFQSLQSLISLLPQTEGNTFQTLIIEALQTIPFQASTMSRATPDDQLKFLLSCVRHSNNGKVDFVQVAKECSIVSKGAAAKRYERLMKTNNISANGSSTETARKPTTAGKSTTTSGEQKPKTVHEKPAAAKKRKAEQGHPLPSTKSDVKHSSQAQPTTNKMKKVEQAVDSPSFMVNLPPYGARGEGMPVGTRGVLISRQSAPQVYHNQVPRGHFQDFQGVRSMPANHFPYGMHMAMAPVQPNQMDHSLGQFDAQNHGLEEYLNRDVYYKTAATPAVQSQPSLLNSMAPKTFPPPPQEVQFLPQSGEASATQEAKGKKPDGSIIIED